MFTPFVSRVRTDIGDWTRTSLSRFFKLFWKIERVFFVQCGRAGNSLISVSARSASTQDHSVRTNHVIQVSASASASYY